MIWITERFLHPFLNLIIQVADIWFIALHETEANNMPRGIRNQDTQSLMAN